MAAAHFQAHSRSANAMTADDNVAVDAIDRWGAWIEALQDDEIEGGGEPLDASQLLAAGLSELECFAETLTKSEAARRRAAIGIVTRAIMRLGQRAAADRAALLAENASLRRRVDELALSSTKATEACQAAVNELRKALAVTMKDVATERALRRKAPGFLDHERRLGAAVEQRRIGKLAQAIAARRALKVEEVVDVRA
jgi:hypothetical protein